ncbi:MAG TPA: phosphate ABC transporter substrate-binding protein PstS [Candidatus Bathyarchaeia archaeon]|nr:phosphate ABC transporter substrate-binding protein PstS [Candidatus Bathyarchaeia archaeon]
MASSELIPRKPGISKMIFIITLIVVAAVSGVTGYLVNGYLHPVQSAPNETLNGAGATFPYPLLSAIALNYSRSHTNVAINYQSIGSGGGINALIKKTVDFAASDAPLNALQRGNATNSLHIPETVGAVVVAYNVFEPDGKTPLPTGLHLNATVIAKIFLGQINNWNDTSIRQLNPGFGSILPNQQIVSVHRSDGSGTTFVFTGYLTAATTIWTPGQGTSVTWPAPNGLGASGNEGVAGVIRGTPGTIGYVELAYAVTNNMKDANVLNHDGNTYVKPSLTNVTFAVTNATSIFPKGNESWSSVNLLNGPGASTYPIASFSYLLVYQELNVIPGMTLDKAKALVDFLWFTVHNGQFQAPPLSYVPLPQSIVHIDETTIASITYNGQTLPN